MAGFSSSRTRDKKKECSGASSVCWAGGRAFVKAGCAQIASGPFLQPRGGFTVRLVPLQLQPKDNLTASSEWGYVSLLSFIELSKEQSNNACLFVWYAQIQWLLSSAEHSYLCGKWKDFGLVSECLPISHRTCKSQCSCTFSHPLLPHIQAHILFGVCCILATSLIQFLRVTVIYHFPVLHAGFDIAVVS